MLWNELKGDVVHLTTHIQTCLQKIRLLQGAWILPSGWIKSCCSHALLGSYVNCCSSMYRTNSLHSATNFHDLQQPHLLQDDSWPEGCPSIPWIHFFWKEYKEIHLFSYNLMGNMPSGCPVFNVWLKACSWGGGGGGVKCVTLPFNVFSSNIAK